VGAEMFNVASPGGSQPLIPSTAERTTFPYSGIPIVVLPVSRGPCSRSAQRWHRIAREVLPSVALSPVA